MNKQTYLNIANEISHQAELTAITKNRSVIEIEPLIKLGHRIFGENKVQEAKEKWPQLKKKYPDIKLHMVGHLQSNKLVDAVELFDVIESLDRPKLAEILADLAISQESFIQINIGNEPQKSGIPTNDADDFINYCKNELKLNITGIMCIAPLEQDPAPFFAKMQDYAIRHNLPKLSMGMSDDYLTAIKYGANLVRIGRKLFE